MRSAGEGFQKVLDTEDGTFAFIHDASQVIYFCNYQIIIFKFSSTFCSVCQNIYISQIWYYVLGIQFRNSKLEFNLVLST